MRDILLTYSFYNFDLGYCQVLISFQSSFLALNYKLALSLLLWIHILGRLPHLAYKTELLDTLLFLAFALNFSIVFNWQMFFYLVVREWVIICLLSCSWWRMNQNLFGVSWHWWNDLDPTLTVTRMGCILSSLHSQRSIIFFLREPLYNLHFAFLPFYQHSASMLGDLNLKHFFFIFTVTQLVELLDSPLHNYFKENDCLNYFFCFRWILIQFKRFVSSFLPLFRYWLDVCTTTSFWDGQNYCYPTKNWDIICD